MAKGERNIRNNVIAGVLATLIASGIIAFVPVVRDFVLRLAGQSLGLLQYLKRPVALPLWLVALLCLGSVCFALLVAAFLVSRRAPRPSQEESSLNYRKDEFGGVVWRWRMESDFEPYTISAFCPVCDMQLEAQTELYGYAPSTYFTCDKCHYRSQPFNMDPGELQAFMLREIQRRLRTGEWRQAKK